MTCTEGLCDGLTGAICEVVIDVNDVNDCGASISTVAVEPRTGRDGLGPCVGLVGRVDHPAGACATSSVAMGAEPANGTGCPGCPDAVVPGSPSCAVVVPTDPRPTSVVSVVLRQRVGQATRHATSITCERRQTPTTKRRSQRGCT
jgi:hypothetical protein